MKKLSFLIPCHNEQANLDALYSRLCDFVVSTTEIPVFSDNPEEVASRLEFMDMKDYEWEFLFVNDGSSDDTLPILTRLSEQDSRVTVVSLSRNFGKENAMLAGLDEIDSDAVVIMDADLQHPIGIVPEMIYWWRRGYDDVYGHRSDRGAESWLRKKMSLSFYKILDRLSDIDTLPNVGDFRLLDRKAVRALTSLRESQRYTKGLFCWVGFKKKGVDFVQADRLAGKSSFNFIKLFNMAVDGITGYTTFPLRIAALAGTLVSLLAFGYLIYIFIKTLIWGETVTGFPTLICVILFLGGLQLLALGIIGEYIGRIFNEVKHRPPYVVDRIIRRGTIRNER